MDIEEALRRLDDIKDLNEPVRRDESEQLDEELEEEAYGNGDIDVFQLEQIRSRIYEVTGYRYEMD